MSLAKNDLKNAQYIQESAKIQLRQNIEQAFFNMTAANKRYNTLMQQVTNYSESFRGAEVRFTEGVSTQIDYLIAKNNLDRAKVNLISAKYAYIFHLKILDYYQGRLVL